MDETKRCSKCGEIKPLTPKYFHRDKSKNDGFTYQCKVCRNKRLEQTRMDYPNTAKKYYKENKEKISKYAKQWYVENRERIAQQYQENKEELRVRSREHYKENVEYYREYNKRYYQKNKKRLLKENSKWAKANKDKIAVIGQRRRANKKRVPSNLTVDKWERIKEYFEYRCAYCGITEKEHIEIFNEQLHQEHFIPLNKGGEYTHNNIIPACKTCNCSKRDTSFLEWYPKQKNYNKEREEKILKYLNYINDDIQQLSIL